MIGLGPMGQAMVRSYLAAGHDVTVWNRTASRADDVVAAGAKRAGTVADALAANELVLLSLTDYQAMYDILAPTEDALRGKIVVNLSSDTPERTRVAAEWLAARGAEMIAGGIMVPAQVVGTESSFVFYSGAEPTFERIEPTLRVIGRPGYRGADPGLAQLYYQSLLDLFLTTLSAFLHSAALVGTAGVPAATLVPYAKELLTLVQTSLDEAAKNVDSGSHPGDEANAKMMGATADHILAASRDAGIDVGLPAAVKEHYDRAAAAGHGRDSWTSLFEVIRGQA
ncbi:NAD(P)-dependent oxidoreductase [Amycolatopsis rubida]|nr:NAD(P)-binding domain-containing protein [Amycolatopsis rubida]MYW97638.1 NAD(P)-binding domain-containing protein [Amycolatopsis rubida]NEC62623.1 NAD(P)-dependent oxidoreductase [Amycolatopsis rubida]